MKKEEVKKAGKRRAKNKDQRGELSWKDVSRKEERKEGRKRVNLSSALHTQVFFFTALEFELRTLHLLGRRSAT
jgi:hypothetical protein